MARTFKWGIALLALCAAVVVPALALAADPVKGGRYTGKSTPILSGKKHSVVIRVSSDGTRGTMRYCGDRPRRAETVRFRIRNGSFKATKRIRRKGRRVVSFQATGTFRSRSRVSGEIVVVFKCDRSPAPTARACVAEHPLTEPEPPVFHPFPGYGSFRKEVRACT